MDPWHGSVASQGPIQLQTALKIHHFICHPTLLQVDLPWPGALGNASAHGCRPVDKLAGWHRPWRHQSFFANNPNGALSVLSLVAYSSSHGMWLTSLARCWPWPDMLYWVERSTVQRQSEDANPCELLFLHHFFKCWVGRNIVAHNDDVFRLFAAPSESLT